ncbi:MAG TPA: hypothetical protein VG651_24060 [Stellaceae bacterium]|nr:hypothetical protein [Stellaceae bacterium]
MTTHRLIAPRHYREGDQVVLSGEVVTIPAGGIVEIDDVVVDRGSNFQTIEGVDGPDRKRWRPHVRELLALGFTHAPAAGDVADRPAGRYPGEPWFCTYTKRPLWWDGAAWRDALGRVA